MSKTEDYLDNLLNSVEQENGNQDIDKLDSSLVQGEKCGMKTMTF